MMSHLSSIQDPARAVRRAVHFGLRLDGPRNVVTPRRRYLSTYKDLGLTHDLEKHVYVSRRGERPVIITNYDPDILTNQERFILHEKADDVRRTTS